MKRITKKSWFIRGRPITWQGWAFTIFYYIFMIFLGLNISFFLNVFDIFYPLILGLFILPYILVVRLTTDIDTDIDTSPSGITNAEISRMLKEKRKNRMK